MIIDAAYLFTGLPAASGIGNTDNTDSPTTGTQASSNILDLGGPGLPVLANLQGARDMGIGDKPAIKVFINVTVAFTVGTSLSATLQGAPDNGSGSPGSYTSWYVSPVYTEAQLVVGARLMDMDLPRPPAAVGVPRFLRISWVSVGTHSTGKVYAGLVLDRPDQMYAGTTNQTLGGYPAGITVSN